MLNVYNPWNIYNSKKERIKKEILKIPTNKRLYTQIHTVVYAHNCT